MNHPCAALLASLLLSMPMAARAAVLTADPLTKIPVDPATVGPFGGNEPDKLPTSTFCSSKMQVDMYSTFNSNIDATNAWYASHLKGFKHGHAYSGGRSHDIYYSADGTMAVSVDGEPGAEGTNVDTHAVLYMLFQPGLPEKTLLGSLQGKSIC